MHEKYLRKDQVIENPFGQSGMVIWSGHLPQLSIPVCPQGPDSLEPQVAEAMVSPVTRRKNGEILKHM